MRVLTFLTLPLLLAGCGGTPTGALLRDDYFGIRVLEPNLTVPPVEHDAFGNAIVRAPQPPGEWPTVRTAAIGR